MHAGLFAPAPGRLVAPTDLACPDCAAGLELRRTCLRAFFHCPGCKATHEVDAMAAHLDEELEARLAALPVDRI
jgi:hypothetical protein